jgi:hypothetical protein
LNFSRAAYRYALRELRAGRLSRDELREAIGAERIVTAESFAARKAAALKRIERKARTRKPKGEVALSG